MDLISDTFVMLLEMGLSMLAMAYIGASIALFIVDGVKAMRQKRKRKIGITIMFIVAMVLVAVLVIAVMLLIGVIIWYVMNS